jgi:hypothetical protein
MVLAGPCRLPVHTFVRIILPDLREAVVTTRRRKRVKTRKITRYLPPARAGGTASSGMPGVIPLTITA